MPTTPIFVLVHGGWHTPAHYQPFVDAVESRGYRITAPSLPSTDDKTPPDPTAADTRVIADTVRTFADAGNEVVLIAHSCGGIATAEAAHGLGVRERSAKGLRGGVRNLVFVSAAVGEAGKPILVAKEMPTDPSEFLALPEGELLILQKGAEDKFYNDLPKAKQEELLSSLVKHPAACLAHVMKNPAYKEVDSVYVYCENDQAVKVDDQRWIVGELKKTGVAFREGSVTAGHFPFINMPERLLDTILELI